MLHVLQVVQKRSYSIADYFSSGAELPPSEKWPRCKRIFLCHVIALIFLILVIWYQIIKLSERVVFLCKKLLWGSECRKTHLCNLRISNYFALMLNPHAHLLQTLIKPLFIIITNKKRFVKSFSIL